MSPDEPTRHTASGSEDAGRSYDAEAGAGEPVTAAGPAHEGREEKGSAAGSRRHPPHVTENSEGGTVESEESAPGEVPILPANAEGSDTVSTEELDQGIDDTSMYDRRRDEDKDTPPSTRK